VTGVVLEVALNAGVLELTLDRPDAMNSFTVELHQELARALKDARNPEVRAILVTGAGRAFSAGQDLAEAQGSETGPGERLQRFYHPNILAIRSLEKPVTAAVNGVAAGAGLALALACDLRVASEKASFVPAFIAIGLIPDSGTSWFTTRLLGEAKAFEWLTSNRRLSAAEALEWGLIHEVVSPDALLERARERAAALAAAPGEAVGMTKSLLRRAVTSTLDEQLELERQMQQAASEHPAYAESIASFLTKQSAPRAGSVSSE
jgi:2-(1,2-epoxy-1,2-dihydrophenyl)acetyl-CoA isomerase